MSHLKLCELLIGISLLLVHVTLLLREGLFVRPVTVVLLGRLIELVLFIRVVMMMRLMVMGISVMGALVLIRRLTMSPVIIVAMVLLRLMIIFVL